MNVSSSFFFKIYYIVKIPHIYTLYNINVFSLTNDVFKESKFRIVRLRTLVKDLKYRDF